MARRTPKKAGKSRAKASKRTANGRARKPAAKLARRPARGKPARKAARASSKAPARKTASTRKPGKSVKRKSVKKVTKAASARKTAAPRKTAARQKTSAPRKIAATPRKTEAPRTVAAAPTPRESAQERRLRTPPASLNRVRRTLDDATVPTPPSSLDMNRLPSAARSGRAELAENQQDHLNMTPAITGGDVDASVETAYFSGDEAPGGDNQTPDQDIVDDIGRALGVQYQDNEELQSGDKLVERDRHRWELDPASSEDYRDRK